MYGKIFIIIGVFITIVGIALYFTEKYHTFNIWNDIPGNFVFKKGNFSFYFPLTFSILASIILTIIIYIVSRIVK
jgi:hypothetical protein